MSFDTHDPSDQVYGGIPTEWHQGIKLYALHRAAAHAQHRSSQGGLTYEQQFQLYLARIRADLNRRTGTLPRARAGRRSRVSQYNDAYIRTNG